jgi:MFS family permease
MSTQQPPRSHIIYTIAIIGFIYTLHLVIPMYSNSSFLSLFANEQVVGLIYMAGAAVTILGFLLAPPIIRRLGNYTTSLWLLAIQIVLFYGLVTATSPYLLAFFFVVQSAIVSLIGLCLDIFLEVYTDGSKVGSVRGLYTATLNASWVIGPLIGSMLINGTENYRNTYVAGLAMLLPLAYLMYKNFPRFRDPNYTHLSPHQLAKHIWHNPNWVRLFFANFILQVFYAWMVVYSPIYLHTVMGFSWESIGIILTIMLLPFPLLQYPLGSMSDKKGEKLIMALGFGIMAVFTILLAFLTWDNLAAWALGLFLTRVGAAAAEVMIETYFFKTVSPRDSAALGLFRITRPVAYFFAPLVTVIGLMFTTQQYLFAIVGVICLAALYPVLTIKDTK